VCVYVCAFVNLDPADRPAMDQVNAALILLAAKVQKTDMVLPTPIRDTGSNAQGYKYKANAIHVAKYYSSPQEQQNEITNSQSRAEVAAPNSPNYHNNHDNPANPTRLQHCTQTSWQAPQLTSMCGRARGASSRQGHSAEQPTVTCYYSPPPFCSPSFQVAVQL
jgi:hypothetical protein